MDIRLIGNFLIAFAIAYFLLGFLQMLENKGREIANRERGMG